ncbi:fibrinogen-like protein 1 [Haliotis rufescens]|uniref:fibrinogen-like protein 1 n=1 Tax=Haliotis rufescens TaxID=6454 RepID=UPI00201EEC32|nr:fibrinogen-like protein 1 [Haliotis rufescens]
MQDCTEGAQTDHYKDFTESSMFHIQPNNAPRTYKVVCNMDGWSPGWTYFLSRSFDRADVNFSRPWAEYKHGFGIFNDQGNFWSGLDMMYHVTNNRPHKMRVFLLFQEEGKLVYRKYIYNDFKVSSESYGYNFTFSSAGSPGVDNNPAIDGMSAFLGSRFSTYDVDNDNDNNGNCANIHQSGWWFTTCDGFNPTGQPQPPSVQYKTSDPTQLSWPHSLNYSPVQIRMFVIAENS